MLNEIRPAIVLMLLFTLLTGIAYPLGMTGIAGAVFPHQAQGSLIVKDGKTIGSDLIGQYFTSDRYFHGRPSATTGTDDKGNSIAQPYNAANSMGSNLGPTAKALIDRIRADAGKLAAENPKTPVPVDMVTTSASGFDPDVTPAGALFQVPRIARARHLDPQQVKDLVARFTKPRTFGIIGEPSVNVLKLNLALDDLAAK